MIMKLAISPNLTYECLCWKSIIGLLIKLWSAVNHMSMTVMGIIKLSGLCLKWNWREVLDVASKTSHITTLTHAELEHASHGGSGRLYRADQKFSSQDLDKIEGKCTATNQPTNPHFYAVSTLSCVVCWYYVAFCVFFLSFLYIVQVILCIYIL